MWWNILTNLQYKNRGIMKLRPLQIKDAEGMLEWMHNPDIAKNFRFNTSGQTLDKVKNFIENSFDEETKHYAVANENDEYLGTISLKAINREDKTAEYAISMRACAIGTGAAAIATRELLKKAFYEMELNRIYLNVLSDNVRAQKFYEKMGFTYEGEFKQHICKNGEFKDLKWYAILKENFEV